jgi:hypothetical protein
LAGAEISSLVLFCLLLSSPFFSCLLRLVLLLLSCVLLTCLLLPCLVLSSLVFSILVLSCLVLCCIGLSYLVLSCLVFSPQRPDRVWCSSGALSSQRQWPERYLHSPIYFMPFYLIKHRGNVYYFYKKWCNV